MPKAPTPPPVSEFRAIPDPIDRLAALSRLAEVMGHRFPPEHAAERRQAAREARKLTGPDGDTYSLAQIAKMIRRSKTLVWNLLTAGTPAQKCAAPVVLPELPSSKTATGAASNTVAVEVSR